MESERRRRWGCSRLNKRVHNSPNLIYSVGTQVRGPDLRPESERQRWIADCGKGCPVLPLEGTLRLEFDRNWACEVARWDAG
jgi:hypothetical protein